MTGIKRIVLFASGSGSNVENIAHYFKDNDRVNIVGVLCNRRDAAVLDRCNRLGISSIQFNRTAFYDTDTVLRTVRALEPDLIVLAGFLWKIPEDFVRSFGQKTINIHPALLPKYGGKGMYGIKVHESVKNNQEAQTGITIHYVNEHYDEGGIICQHTVAVLPEDSVEDIAQKVHALEYEHFPQTIAKLLDVQ